MAKKKDTEEAAAVSSEDGDGARTTKTRDENDNNPIPSDEQGYPLPTEEQLKRQQQGAL